MYWRQKCVNLRKIRPSMAWKVVGFSGFRGEDLTRGRGNSGAIGLVTVRGLYNHRFSGQLMVWHVGTGTPNT